jgi:hypothetical protein
MRDGDLFRGHLHFYIQRKNDRMKEKNRFFQNSFSNVHFPLFFQTSDE